MDERASLSTRGPAAGKITLRDRVALSLFPKTLSPARIRAARLIAIAADALQIFFFPLFGEGFLSPADDVLDAAVAIALTRLVGFHWSYLPSAVAEVIPGVDLAPTWTAAAFLATRGRGPAPASAAVAPRRWPVIAATGALILLAGLAIWFWNHPARPR